MTVYVTEPAPDAVANMATKVVADLMVGVIVALGYFMVVKWIFRVDRVVRVPDDGRRGHVVGPPAGGGAPLVNLAPPVPAVDRRAELDVRRRVMAREEGGAPAG